MISKYAIEEIGKKIVNSAYEVHSELGPGLLESVYELCMVEELKSRNLLVERQLQLPVIYKGIRIQKDYYIDLLVENSVIIELKAVENLTASS